MENLFSIILWIALGIFYIGAVIWSFRDYWDQDNLLYKEDETWYPDDDSHLGI